MLPQPHDRQSAWQPLRDPKLALAARESVERVAEELVPEVQSGSKWFDLANGSSGQALVLAHLSEYLDRPDLLETSRGAWGACLDQLAAVDSIQALYGGFCGPAWVAAHLGDRVADDDDESVHEEIESTLLAFLEGPAQHANYDLILGLVGLGVYALERWPRGHSMRILRLIVDRIVALGERVEEGVTWNTPPDLVPPTQREYAPWGYRNLGLAHGIPGILGFLGRASRVGALSPEGARALEDGVAWILEAQRPLQHGMKYPWWLPTGQALDAMDWKGSRVAWCYGDLGVAASLLVAGQGHGRKDWEAEAIALARNCASVPVAHTGVRDAGLCHGAAGVGHMFLRLANTTGDDVLRNAARFWFERTLEMRTPGVGIDGYMTMQPRYPRASRAEDLQFELARDASFLTGAPGVALALAAGFSDREPTWDRVLLLSG